MGGAGLSQAGIIAGGWGRSFTGRHHCRWVGQVSHRQAFQQILITLRDVLHIYNIYIYIYIYILVLGGINKYSTTVFLKKILRYNYIPTILIILFYTIYYVNIYHTILITEGWFVQKCANKFEVFSCFARTCYRQFWHTASSTVFSSFPSLRPK